MSERILRLPEVMNRSGLCRSAIYDKVKNKEWPAPIRISTRAVGRLESEVTLAIQKLIRKSRPEIVREDTKS